MGAGCTRPAETDRGAGMVDPAKSASRGPVQEKRAEGPARTSPPVLDLVKGFDACTLGHRGTLLDLGDATTRARVTTGKLPTPDLPTREHEGSSWAVLREKSLAVSFVATTEAVSSAGVVVEARVRGGAAKSLQVFLGGKLVGVLPLARGEIKVVSTHATGPTIARGANELLFKATGTARGAKDDLVEIDWVRVGPYDGDAPYSAPTRNDALTTVTLGGVGRRGLSLRAPGFARCAGYVPNGAVLEGFVGVAGGAEAEAEVRVLVDRSEPRVVGSVQLNTKSDGAGWRPVALPLGDVGTIAGIELVAKSSSKGARVVFAEPRVVAPSAKESTPLPAAKSVVLVVLGSTSRRSLKPWGGSVDVPELTQLAASGLVFEQHRASTSLASGAVASMLTGLSPRRHGVTDSDAALPPSIATLAETSRHAGVMTAMFTANPTTSSTYGFARGWETFVARSPLEDEPAVAIFEHAGRWLDAHKQDRFFLVVHARAGHPPWDVASDQLKDMPPTGYAGSLDAKHAGEMLGKAKKPGSARLTDADRVRAFALHERAVAAHDAAMGRLVAQLRAIGRDSDTALFVTGDVGYDAAAIVPFLESEVLDESTLGIPLVAKAPGVTAARVSAPTSSVDLARSILEVMGLTPPVQLEGESLWGLAGSSGARAGERPAFATAGARFSARWGGFVLAGARDRDSKLCNLSLEPDCVGDVRASHPLAAEVMHALVVDELWTGAQASPPREPRGGLTDPAVLGALKAWGR